MEEPSATADASGTSSNDLQTNTGQDVAQVQIAGSEGLVLTSTSEGVGIDPNSTAALIQVIRCVSYAQSFTLLLASSTTVMNLCCSPCQMTATVSQFGLMTVLQCAILNPNIAMLSCQDPSESLTSPVSSVLMITHQGRKTVIVSSPCCIHVVNMLSFCPIHV